MNMGKTLIRAQLRRLREEIEKGSNGLLSDEQVYLLDDVCRVLFLDEADTEHVIGEEVYTRLIGSSVDCQLISARLGG